ncbi:hypothetical protein [Dyella sp. 2HG41-7]|uniref:hypothetical protein n=1 Tax=Dyella sp. 2HG41-7 TaxID=2883239 RepID=UPI001F3E447A|nr:hypothetical protein [Dyella sp. 2HG41-7]
MAGESRDVTDVASVAEAVGASPVSEAFSFAWLESRLAPYVQVDDDPVINKLVRFALAGMVLFGGLGVIAGLTLRNQLGLHLLYVGLALELLCGMTALLNALRQAWRDYQQQHTDFARGLDEKLVPYNDVVDAIRHYPLSVIDTHLRYVRDRKSRLTFRAGVLSGGLEKFGVLPLLLALYLQFKDWSFGDWKGITDHVHWVGYCLLCLLIPTYIVSWWAVRTKSRLELYEVVLTEASVRESDEK